MYFENINLNNKQIKFILLVSWIKQGPVLTWPIWVFVCLSEDYKSKETSN